MSNSQQLLNSVTNEGMTFLSSDVAETVKNVGVVVNAQTDPSSTNIIVIPPTDRELSSTSGNPVEYHAVKKEYDKKVKNITTPGTGFFVKSSGGTVFQDPIAGGMSSRYETSNAEPITNAGILNSKFAEYLDFPTNTASYDRYYSASGYVGPAPRKQTINSNAATSNNEPFSNNAFNTVYSDATNKIDEILTNEPDFTPLPEVGSSFIYSRNSWDFRKQGTVTTGTLASNKTELVNGNKIEFSDTNQTSSLLNGIPFNSGAGTQKYIILDDYGNISSNSSNVNNLGDEFSIEVYFKLPAESDLNNTDQNLIFNLSDALPANVTSTNPQNSIFLTVKSSVGNVSNNLVDYCLYAYNGQNSYVKWSPTYPVGETSPGIYTGAQQTIAAGTYHDMAHKKSEFVWLLISVKLDSTGANLPTVTFFEHFQQHSVANDTYIKERTSTTTNAGTIDSIKTPSYWASRRIMQIGGENKILGHDSGYTAADFYAKTFRLFTGYTFTLGMADQLRRITDIRNNPFTYNDNTNLDPWHLDRVTRNDEKDSRFSNVAYPRLLMNFLATTAPTYTGTGSINSTDGLVVGSGYSVTLTGAQGTNMGYIGGDEFSIETVFKFDTFASDQTIFEFYTDNSSSGASSDFFKQYTFTPNQVYRFILRRFGSTRRLELLVDTFQDDYHGASVLASDQGKPTHRPGIAPEDINSNATSNWVQGQKPLRIISEEIDASIFPSSGAMPEFAHMVLTYKRKSTTSKEVETDKCKLFIKRADNNYKPYDYQLKFRNDSDSNLTDQPSNPQTGFIPYVKREFHKVNGNIKMKLLNFYDHALLNDVEANYLNAGEIQKVFRYYQETNGSKFYTLGRSVDFTTCTTSSAATEHSTNDSHKTTIGATTTTEPFNVVTSCLLYTSPSPRD